MKGEWWAIPPPMPPFQPPPLEDEPMTAARQALDLAHQHGVVVEARGDRLHLTAPKPPPPEVLDALRRHKAEVMPLLAPRPAHKFPSAIAPRPLSEIYVTLPGDEWLADGFYYMRRRAMTAKR